MRFRACLFVLLNQLSVSSLDCQGSQYSAELVVPLFGKGWFPKTHSETLQALNIRQKATPRNRATNHESRAVDGGAQTVLKQSGVWRVPPDGEFIQTLYSKLKIDLCKSLPPAHERALRIATPMLCVEMEEDPNRCKRRQQPRPNSLSGRGVENL